MTKNLRLELHIKGGPFKLVEKDIPEPPPQGLVIKTHFAGLCHTDSFLWKAEGLTDDFNNAVWGPDPEKCERVIGHEISGEIIALGSEVESGNHDLKVKDRVAVFANQKCKDLCQICKEGKWELCQNIAQNTLGMGRDGGYQSYVSIPYIESAYRIPDSIPMDVASLFPCAAGTAYNAVTKVQSHIEAVIKNRGNASVLIVGCGGLGLWAISLAKSMLPADCSVIAVDVSDKACRVAKEQGADQVVLWTRSEEDNDVVATTKVLGPGGANAVIDFVCTPATFRKGYCCAAIEACYAVVGTLSSDPIPLKSLEILKKELKILGVQASDPAQQREMCHLVATKKVKSCPIEHIRLQDVEENLRNSDCSNFCGRKVIKF